MKKEDEKETLKLSIEELKVMHDEICENYSNAKSKILFFLAGAFAFLSYLFTGKDLFIPDELYGAIIYFLGLALCIPAFVLEMHH